jgi:hypothetical protein
MEDGDLFPFPEVGLDLFRTEIFFTECCRFFRVKPGTGKNIEIDTFLIFRKMRRHGTRFD